MDNLRKEDLYGLAYAAISPFVTIIALIISIYFAFEQLVVLIIPGILGLSIGIIFTIWYLKKYEVLQIIGITMSALCGLIFLIFKTIMNSDQKIATVCIFFSLMYLPLSLFRKAIKKSLSVSNSKN